MKIKNLLTSKFEQLGRVGAAPAKPQLANVAAAAQAVMRPRKQYAALEARILFDAAGVAAADHQFDNPEAQHMEAQRIACEQARAAERGERGADLASLPTLAVQKGNTVVVIDSRVANYQELLKDIDPSATVRIVGENEDGVAVISQLLGSTGNVSSLQIVSHGESGAIRLGSATLNSAALDDPGTAAQLQGWHSGMTAGADILILGCDVAKGDKGQSFVQKLADLTQADISASVDDTGAASKGGNWVLEFNVGQRDSRFAFSQRAMDNYADLLPAGPVTTLSLPAETLIGATNQPGSVTFSSTGSIGYAPYVAVAFNSNRAAPSALDPISNANEGITYVPGSGMFLGSALPDVDVLTFVGGVASSTKVIDPVTGAPLVFNAADYGMGEGDTLVIYQLPFGSFTATNPAAKIDFKYNVGANADSANPVVQGGENAGGVNTNISSRGLFLYGNTPAAENEPVLQSATATASTNPIWYKTSYINSSRELEQVPGVNDKQYFIADLSIAPNQTVLSNNGAINAANPGATTNRFVSRLSIPSNINFDPLVDVKLTFTPASFGGAITDPAVAGTTIFVVNKVTGTPSLLNPVGGAAGYDDGTTPNLPVRNPVTGAWTIARPTSPANNSIDLIAIAPANTSFVGGANGGALGLQLNYFIPDTVIDPATGLDVPQSFDAKHTGNVKFADSDDPQNNAFVVDPAAIVINYQTIQIQKTVAGATPDLLDPANPNGVRSGDELTYTLTVQVGDFYGVRNVIITDTLADGIDFVPDSMTITSGNVNGQALAGTPITATDLTVFTGTTNDTTTGVATVKTQSNETPASIDVDPGAAGTQVGGNGKQVLQFNLSNAIASKTGGNTSITGAQGGDLLGDAFGSSSGQGLTTVTITYKAKVRDVYRVAANGNTTGASTGSQLLENDLLKNDVRISGELLKKTSPTAVTAALDSGGSAIINADTSAASVSVKDGKLDLELFAVNGVLVGYSSVPKDASGKPIIAAGDNVTYRLRYNLTQGDFNDLKLEGFLPDPIFQANDPNLDGALDSTLTAVTTPATFVGANNPAANWAQAGTYTLGPTHNQSDVTLGSLGTDVVSSTTTASGGNSIAFTIPKSSSKTANPGGVPNAQTAATDPANNRVDILFTVKASDKPYADNLLLTTQGRETADRSGNGGVSQATPLPDDAIIQVVRAEPRLVVSLGVLSKVNGQGGAITGNTGLGTVPDAGTAASTAPFSTTLTSAGQINGNVTNVDAGDVLRMGFAIQNKGGSGAFDVKTTAIDPPPGYKFVSLGFDATAAGNNFQVRTGAGVLLNPGADYTVTTDGSGRAIIELVDGATTAKLGKGRTADGAQVADGSNIVVISYDVIADDGTGAKAIAAKNSTSVLAVDSYSSVNGGTDFTTTLNAGTGGQVRDDAQLEIAKPTVDIRWQGNSTNDKTATNDDSNQGHTTGGNLVIGEKGYFDIKVTVPEGQTTALFADINLPAGLAIDSTYNSGIGYDIITTTGGTGANGIGVNGELTVDFAANTAPTAAFIGGMTPQTGGVAVGTLGNSGVGGRVSLGTIITPNDNNTGNNSFIVRVRVTAVNVLGNQQGTTLPSNSSGVFTDTDGATGGGAAVVSIIADTTTANDPTITIVEPTVTTVKTAVVVDTNFQVGGDQPGPEADENDEVEFTINLKNTSGVKAWDLTLNDTLPSQFGNFALVSVQSTASTNTVTTSTGAVANGVARQLTTTDFIISAGANPSLSFAAGTYDLDAGGTITVTARGKANGSIAGAPVVNNDAFTRWTSLDRSTTNGNVPAGERGGAAGQLLAGGPGVDVGEGTTSGTTANAGALATLQGSQANGLNNYQTASRAVVLVVPIVPVLSRIGTINDTSPNNNGNDTKDGSPTSGTPQTMVVGELTRFRMVVKVPAGVIPNFLIQPTLPPGYTYLGDAKVALVSDVPMTSSALGASPGLTRNDGITIAGTTQNDDGTGQSDIWKSVQKDLVTGTDTRANIAKPTAPITADTANPAAPKFDLGTLTNSDNDIDSEYVVIEFTAVVSNVSSNQQDKTLDTVFTVTSGAPGNVNTLTSNTTRDKVVEPYIAAVDKRVANITGGTQGATAVVDLSSCFTNTGVTPAYNVLLVDLGMPAGATAPTFTSLTVGATTYSFTADPALATAGIVITANGNGFNVAIDKLDPNQTVTLKYKDTFPTNLASDTSNAVVTYSSAPTNSSQNFAGTSGGSVGSPTGERDGTQGTAPNAIPVTDTAGPLDNYRVSDKGGVSTIKGVLWDDTNSPNGSIDAGVNPEKLLGGVTVTLLWAGSDGVFGSGGDDVTLTTKTAADGSYSFGILPGDDTSTPLVNEGRYRISVPTSVLVNGLGDDNNTPKTLTPRYDADGDANTLSLIEVLLPANTAVIDQNFGYVQPNLPPENSFAGSTTFPSTSAPFAGTVATPIKEDIPFAFNNTNGALITIADPDGDQGDGKLTTTVTAANGTLAATNGGGTGTVISATGTGTVIITGTKAEINQALATLQYTSVANYSGADTITVITNDRGQGGNVLGAAAGSDILPRENPGVNSPDRLVDTDVINIVVAPVSDAPTLSTPAVIGTEDTAIPLNITVTPTDTTGTPEVLAVTISGIPSTWVLTDGSGNPISVTAGSVTLTGLTPAQIAAIKITPPTDVHSIGAASLVTLNISVTSQDGAAPASTAVTSTLDISVKPVNDRPVADTVPGAVVVASTLEGNMSPTGTAVGGVGGLFTSRFSDPKDAAKPNGADTMIGIVITGTAAVPATEGVWQYSVNGGANWFDVAVTTSDSTAIFLRNTDQVRFKPVDSNYSGTPGILTVRLVEGDQSTTATTVPDVTNGPANGTTIGTGADGLTAATTAGSTVNIFAPVNEDGQFATGVVSNPVTATTSVTAVSDAPVLTLGSGASEASNPANTTGVQSSPGSPATGNVAAGTVAGSVRGVEDTPIPLNISVASADASTPETLSTIVITGVPTGWKIKDASNADVTTLAATTGLTPEQLAGLTITAPSDVNSTGLVGTNPAATLRVTVTSKDGAADLATTTGTLKVAITPVNDAPSFPSTTTTNLAPINEDVLTADNTGVDVTLAFPGYTDPKDLGQTNGADNRVGVLITNNAAKPAEGKWQYLVGTTWTDVPTTVSDTSALYLPDGTKIRFNPATDYNGTPGKLTARLVEDDQASAAADLPTGATGTGFGSTTTIRPGLDVTAGGGVGGTSRISANTRDVSIVITPVNDIPVVVTPGNTVATALNVGDVPISFVGPNAIVLSDVDEPTNTTAIVTVTITPTVNGRPFITALTTDVTQTSGPAVGTIPAAGGTPIVLSGTIANINLTLKNLEYRSVALFNGPDSFTVKIDDLNNGQGLNGALNATNTVNIFNTPLNDRPVPIGSTPDYATLLPGGTTPGRTVQQLFGTRFTDPRDTPTPNGGDVFAAVAVIGVPPISQGFYQYSTDNGATYTTITATPATALVLEPTALVRFVAAPGFVGATTPLKAVLIETDQIGTTVPGQKDLLGRSAIPFDTAGGAAPTTGTILNLATLDADDIATSNNGIGRSRFSSLANPLTVGVAIEQPVNDRPVLTSALPVELAPIAEGTPTSAAQTVGALFSSRYSDPIDAGQILGADTFQGVFVSGSAANPVTEGVWEYSLDGGATFKVVPAATSDGSAIYLGASSQLRFKPVDSNYAGTPGQLTVRLVETDQGDVPFGGASGTTIGNSIDSLAPGAVVNIAGPVASAGQFASGRVSEPLNLSIVITPVSDAPILTLGVGPEEPGNPPGTTGVQSSPGSPLVGNNATGAVAGSVRGLEDTPIPLGIKIAPADTSNPEAITTVTVAGVPTGWVFKDGNGVVIPTPGGSAAGLTPAQLLGATLTAPSDFNGAGAVGASPAATLTITVSSKDGTAPPAVTTGTLKIAVSPVNDAPAFPSTDTTVLPSIKGDAASVAVSVATAFPGFSDPKDVGKTNGGDNRVGVLITSNAASPAQGNWQYFDGANWVDVPRNVSDNNALYLPDGTQIRFNPASGFSGAPGNLGARLVEDDQAGANADLPANATGAGFGPTNVIRPGVNLSAGVGGTSRVSANTRDVGISVTPLPVAPPVVPPVAPPVSPPVVPPVGPPVGQPPVGFQPLPVPAPIGGGLSGGAGSPPATGVVEPQPQPAAGVLGALASPANFSPAVLAPVGLAVRQSQRMANGFAADIEPMSSSTFGSADLAPVGLAVQQSQAMSAAQEAAGNQLFASNLGNSGLQPNWLMPEGIPGQDPFAAPLPEVQAAVPVPFEAAPRKALTAEELRLIECAKPRVVAKPRLPGAIARPMPRFEPGSEAAKRFSEQLKRARARARC